MQIIALSKDRLTSLLKPAVLNARAYHVTNANGMIKLDAMENPFTLPEAIKQEWFNTLVRVDANRYPDPSAAHMEKILRNSLNIPESSEMLFGNGSDEVIQILLLSLRPDSGPVLVPEPTFTMYGVIAAYIGLPFHGVPLGADFALDRQAMLAAIEQHNPGIIFLACPNNPSGNLFNPSAIESIIQAAPGLVIIDEAYHIFAGTSMAWLLDKYDHVLIMCTLSKLGLAGLRLGILFGRPQWITQFKKIRLPYNISILNQTAIAFIMEHMNILEEQIRMLVKQRDALFAEMSKMEQVQVWPSKANFLLFRIKAAADVYRALQKKGILIRDIGNTHPQLKNCLRVTIGTPEENAIFMQSLREVL